MSHADRAELASWHSLLTTPDALAMGARFTHLGQGGVFTTPGVPHVMFNRAIGVPRSLWPQATRLLEASGQPWFLHGRGDEEPAGCVRYPRSWLKLHRLAAPMAWPSPPQGLTLRQATTDDAADVGRIYCDAFDIPESGRRLVAAIVGRSGWEALVVADGRAVVGIGLMFVDGDQGYLAGGATVASHRRRGVQRALVQARIARAEELGLREVFTETGEAKAGEPQHSFRNLERGGLVVREVRHNYCVPGTTWAALVT